jgi:hypothetical protein
MDVNKTSPDESIEKRYAEIAKKTAAAIAAEESPSVVNIETAIHSSLPQLPRYQPPPPRPPSPPRGPQMMCRMFFPTSGHMGFDKVKLSDEYPSIDIVREMIAYETRLRLSNSIQELMDEYYRDENAVT